MNIWIMRHAEADFNAKTDNQRTLTVKGKQISFEQGKKLGKYFKNQNVVLDKVLVSPYMRTQQTYHKVLEGFQAVDFMQNFANLTEIWDGITPVGSTKTVVDYLAFLKSEGAKNVLIISHLPLVLDLVLELTNHKHQINFYPAVIAEIEWLDNVGRLIEVGLPISR